jgi:hypothetical protein
MNIAVQSWQDLQIAMPVDPKSIIANASLVVTQGIYTRSTTFLEAAWAASPLAFTGNNTQLITLNGTDASTIADAAQWTLNHQMVNVAANIPTSLNKLVFLRAGKAWQNQIEINFGASTYTSVQLSFRDNLGTSGQFLNSATGAVPVISFSGGITGNKVLNLTLTQTGVYSMVLVMVTGGNWSAFEMEWVVLP